MITLQELVSNTKKVEPQGSVFPLGWRRVKHTKHQNKLNKKTKPKGCGHRIFTLRHNPEKFDPWRLPSIQGTTPSGQTVYMGNAGSGKSQILNQALMSQLSAQHTYKQSLGHMMRGQGKTVIYDMEMLDWNYNFRQITYINEIEDKVAFIHDQVCGCKQFVFENQKVRRNESTHRISCKDMTMLEFQLGFEEDLNEIFNGRRTNTRV